MDIQEILTKYENFYKGGSGYTFQVEVDDFNEIVKHIKWLEHLKTELEYQLKTCKEDVCEMEKEIVEHCETKGLAGRQVFALTKRVDELVEERKGFKTFLQQTSDIDKRADALIKVQVEKIERYEKALKQCMEAMRKNLAYAQLKDEQVLYDALKNAEKITNSK